MLKQKSHEMEVTAASVTVEARKVRVQPRTDVISRGGQVRLPGVFPIESLIILYLKNTHIYNFGVNEYLINCLQHQRRSYKDV